MLRWADHPVAPWVVAALAFVGAAVGARPYAGSWNDGSRLAAVESLVERGTLAIDGSIFVAPPPELLENGLPPYAPDNPANVTGTCDRLLINGRFYSDKPAVISVLMAGAYKPLVWLGVPRPSVRPDIFCRVMTLLSSGLGFAAAAGCLWAIGRRVGLAPRVRLVWVAAFAFATFAPAYTRQVNNHAMQLGIVAGLCALFARSAALGSLGWLTSAGLGVLVGIGFNLDLGSGPLLALAVGVAVVWRARRVGPVLAYVLAAVPWMAAGMWVNYAIGGVLKPMNMVPEYSQWPGCPFNPANMTGFVRYGPIDQARYLYCLLFGSPGFFTHNLPLWLTLAAGVRALRRPFVGRGELFAVLAWCAATWLLYGFLSNNYGGKCVSIRWFMPFLAPGFWLLAIILRDRPELRTQFVTLTSVGAVLGTLMWWVGPWALHMVPLLWPVVVSGLVAWAWVARRTRVAVPADRPAVAPEAVRRAA